MSSSPHFLLLALTLALVCFIEKAESGTYECANVCLREAADSNVDMEQVCKDMTTCTTGCYANRGKRSTHSSGVKISDCSHFNGDLYVGPLPVHPV